MSLRSEQFQAEESLTVAVATAVADAKGVSPTALSPLYDAINPDALTRLFDAGDVETVAFTYEGHDVVVENDGGVDVTPA